METHQFCLASAGVLFLVGLVTGTWKYAWIARTADARAPTYVDIAHRAALMYAFACALLHLLTRENAWPFRVTFSAAVILVGYFAITILGYVVHGVLRDTDNQLARPHRLGSATVPPRVMMAFMISVVVVEIGAFTVILSGYISQSAS
jgi:hypothetical protein